MLLSYFPSIINILLRLTASYNVKKGFCLCIVLLERCLQSYCEVGNPLTSFDVTNICILGWCHCHCHQFQLFDKGRGYLSFLLSYVCGVSFTKILHCVTFRIVKTYIFTQNTNEHNIPRIIRKRGIVVRLQLYSFKTTNIEHCK